MSVSRHTKTAANAMAIPEAELEDEVSSPPNTHPSSPRPDHFFIEPPEPEPEPDPTTSTEAAKMQFLLQAIQGVSSDAPC